jgi:fluoride ion exporter CrcB/FEX
VLKLYVANDGVQLDLDSLRVGNIREEQEYGGARERVLGLVVPLFRSLPKRDAKAVRGVLHNDGVGDISAGRYKFGGGVRLEPPTLGVANDSCGISAAGVCLRGVFGHDVEARMTELQLVGLGGLAGVGERYVLGGLVGKMVRLRHAVVTTNVLGPSLLVAGAHIALRGVLSSVARVALTTGAIGGFMVLATFNSDTIRLMQKGSRARCLIIMAAAAVGCLIAGALGLGIARMT